MTTKPNTTEAIQTAAAQGSANDPQQGCPDCKKSGLAILPVIPMPLPNALRAAGGEFQMLDGHYQAEDLKTHWYALRTLPTGYLYVLKPDKTWDGYIVDSEGLLRGMPPGLMPASPADVTPMSQACKRGGDNIPAQVIAIDPAKHAAVWMAFSRYRWTAQVLADYAANKEGRRDKRMTKIDVMAAANGSLGSTSKADNAVRFGVPMSAQVGQYVADYASDRTCEAINQRVATPVRKRAAQASALAIRMADISKNTAGKTGAIIALRDDLGVTMELNALRNAETAKLGTYIAENQRKRFVGSVIMGFEKTYAENGHGELWNERFLKHYKREQIVADENAFKAKADPWEKQINAISDDVALLNGATVLKAWWRDFDPGDDLSAKDRQDATAACLHGAVKTQAEEVLWEQWFGEDPRDPYATLWGAATALDAKLGEFLFGKSLPNTGESGKLIDIAKGIVEAKKEFFEQLEKRSSHEALGIIGLAMSSQLTRLKIVNPDLYRVAGARVFIVASARTTVTMTPVSLSVTRTQHAMMMAEAAFGPPQASMKRLLDIETTASKRVFVVGSNGVDAYAFESINHSTQKARVVELWLPDEVANEVSAGAKLPASPVLKALPLHVNPYQGLMKYTKSLSGAFVWAGGLLQLLNLGTSGREFIETEDNTADAYAGIVSGTLGVAAATLEIWSGTMSKMGGARFAATTVARVALAGGVLAGFSAITESAQLWIKANQTSAAGDEDASNYYRYSSWLIGLSGVTTILGALVSFGVGIAGIPVWGWVIASIILLGASVYMLWQAIKATDTPMEQWLEGCIYGRHPKFAPKEEMDKLNDVFYPMTIEVDWEDASLFQLRQENFFDAYDSVNFSISLPGIGAASMIDCKISLSGKDGRKQIFHETIRPRMQGGNAVDPHIAVIGPAPDGPRVSTQPSYVWNVPPAIRGTNYTAQLKVDDAIYSKAEIEFQYWPDEARRDFVLPSTLDKRIPVFAAED